MSFEITPVHAVLALMASMFTSLWLMKWQPIHFKRPWPYYVGQGVQMTLMLALLGALITDLPRELIEATGDGLINERTEHLLVILYFTIAFGALALGNSVWKVVTFVRERAAKRVSAEANP